MNPDLHMKKRLLGEYLNKYYVPQMKDYSVNRIMKEKGILINVKQQGNKITITITLVQ